MGDGNGYTILTDSVPIDDGDTCRSVIEAICGIYDYKIDCQRVYFAMKEFKFTTADIFLVRLVIKEMRVTYDISNISLYDMYENWLCLNCTATRSGCSALPVSFLNMCLMNLIM